MVAEATYSYKITQKIPEKSSTIEIFIIQEIRRFSELEKIELN